MKRNICNLVLKNKRVLIRADLNVPLKPNGDLLSTERITASIPTIVRAIHAGAKVIILSHLGRVKSEVDKEKLSLFAVGRELHRQLEYVLQKKINFFFTPFTSGPEVEESVAALKPGDVLLLENTRFEDLDNKSESGNSPELAARYAALANVYINDAFGTVHRSHASNVGVAKLVSKRGFGFLVAKELERLSALIEKPASPYVVIVGGAKIADKFTLLVSLLKRVDYLLVGGGIAYTIMAAIGKKIGGSIYEESMLKEARSLYRKYKDKIILPIDFACAKSINGKGEYFETIPDDLSSFDLGPKSVELFKGYISRAKTIFWNGPLGVYESTEFAVATNEVAKAIAENTSAYKVIGGGDSAAAVAPFADRIDHISTGGGASLSFLEEKPLPGIVSIQDCNDKCRYYCGDTSWLEVIKGVESRIAKLKVNPEIAKKGSQKEIKLVDGELRKDMDKLLNQKRGTTKKAAFAKAKTTKTVKKVATKKSAVKKAPTTPARAKQTKVARVEIKAEEEVKVLEVPKVVKESKTSKTKTAARKKTPTTKSKPTITKKPKKSTIKPVNTPKKGKSELPQKKPQPPLPKEESLRQESLIKPEPVAKKKEVEEKKLSFFARIFKRNK